MLTLRLSQMSDRQGSKTYQINEIKEICAGKRIYVQTSHDSSLAKSLITVDNQPALEYARVDIEDDTHVWIVQDAVIYLAAEVICVLVIEGKINKRNKYAKSKT